MDKNFNFGQPFVVVGALVEKDGKYLLVKEAGGPDVGKWNIPAGVLDLGESFVDGAKREVEEETNYKIEIPSLLGVYSTLKKNPTVQTGLSQAVKFIFIGKIIEDKQKELHEDVSEIKWFSRDEIFEMDRDTLRSEDIKKKIADYENGISYPLEVLNFMDLT